MFTSNPILNAASAFSWSLSMATVPQKICIITHCWQTFSSSILAQVNPLLDTESSVNQISTRHRLYTLLSAIDELNFFKVQTRKDIENHEKGKAQQPRAGAEMDWAAPDLHSTAGTKGPGTSTLKVTHVY